MPASSYGRPRRVLRWRRSPSWKLCSGPGRIRPAAPSSERPSAARLYLIEARDSAGQLDVGVLHERLLRGLLGIGEEAVRDEKNLRYMRGLDAAVAEARSGAAQIAFLLKPVSVDAVARISFGGGVMPQKSTDFYPKLLSGLTIYKLES